MRMLFISMVLSLSFGAQAAAGKKRTAKMDVSLDEMKTQLLEQKVSKGKYRDNSKFYKSQVEPLLANLAKAAQTGDRKSFAKDWPLKDKIEFLEGEKNQINRAFELLNCVAKKGTLKVSPYYEQVDENPALKKRDLMKLKDEKYAKRITFNGQLSLYQGTKSRIRNPGSEFKFVLQKGELVLEGVSSWNAEILTDMGCTMVGAR